MNNKVKKVAITALAVMTIAGASAALGINTDSQCMPVLSASAATTSSTAQTALKNTSTISSTLIKNGGAVTVKPSASGGASNYTYTVKYRKSAVNAWTNVTTTKSTSAVKIVLNEPTIYDVQVIVKDKVNTTSTKTFMTRSYKTGDTSNNAASGCVVGTRKSTSINGIKYDYVVDSSNMAYIYRITVAKNMSTLRIPSSINGSNIIYIDKGALYDNSYVRSIREVIIDANPSVTMNIHKDAFKIRTNNGLLAASSVDRFTSTGTIKIVKVNYDSNGKRSYVYNQTLADALPNLKMVNLSKTSYISPNMFKNCKNLLEAKLTNNTGTSQTNNYITIGDSAFENCPKLYKVRCGQLYRIGKRAFYGDTKLYIFEIKQPQNTNLTIDEYAFYGDTELKIIEVNTISNNINIVINKGAFKNCNNFNLPTNSKLVSNITKIGDYAFMNCCVDGYYSLDKVKTIGMQAFENSNISLVKTKVVTSIGTNAFSNCKNLKNVEINREQPNNIINTIGDYAFENCTNLDRVTLTNTKSIGNHAFENDTNIYNVRFYNTNYNNNYIGAKAFYNCTSLKYIETLYNNTNPTNSNKNNVTSIIGTEAFNNCTNLQRFVTNNDHIGFNISTGAFKNCSELQSLPTKITAVGDYAFLNCINLRDISLKDIKSIGNSAFKNCSLLNAVYIESNTLNTIGNSAFANCTKLNRIINDRNIKCKINDYAFYNCTNLVDTDDLLYSTTTIGESAFRNTNIKNVKLDKINYINKNAFLNCKNLKNVCINQTNLISIETQAFKNCTNMTLNISGNCKYNLSLGDNAFKNDLKIDVDSAKLLIGNNVDKALTAFDPQLFVNNTEVYAKDITFGETTYVNIRTPYAAQFDKINYTVFYKRPKSNSWTQLNVSKDGTYKIKPTSKGEILVKVVTNAEFNNEMFTGVSSISTFTID